MAFVYWIHLPEHTDMFTEGYIGVTVALVSTRFSQHKHRARKLQGSKHQTTLGNAILKYKDSLMLTKVCICSQEYALHLEKSLRPSPNIGWNIAIGGCVNSRPFGYRHSEETKERQRRAQKNIPRVKWTDERKAAHAESMRRLADEKGPWAAPAANSPAWLLLDKVYEMYINGTTNPLAIKNALGIPEEKSIKPAIRYIKEFGNPLKDSRWVTWKDTHRRDENGPQS